MENKITKKYPNKKIKYLGFFIAFFGIVFWLISPEEDLVKPYSTVVEDKNGELILPLSDELLKEVGWKEGDTLDWEDNKDGTFSITKKEVTEKQWVLVECVSTFRQRYMVEVPVGTDDRGKDKTLWALDTVTMEEAKEFSQEYLGEQIVSHRVLTYDEAIALSDTDNDYTTAWDNDTKVKTFFTTLADQEHE